MIELNDTEASSIQYNILPLECTDLSPTGFAAGYTCGEIFSVMHSIGHSFTGESSKRSHSGESLCDKVLVILFSLDVVQETALFYFHSKHIKL